MIDNPQILVDQFNDNHFYIDQHTAVQSLDAIFIPFRNRFDNVNALLGELKWYQGPIYVMPSSHIEMGFIDYDNNIYELSFRDLAFLIKINELLTSKSKRICYQYGNWDLPAKRNYALWFSRKAGYKRILLLDDDIRGLTPAVLNKAINLLNNYIITGCFVEDFPDTSILGHILRVIGEQEYMFLSGSFLFFNPFEVHGFFPNIYNEDWFFMLPHILTRSICSFGSICQLPYNPFSDPNRAAFQEFGEIIAEGLYTLVSIQNYERRYETQVWENEIIERRQTLISLKERLHIGEYRQVIDMALKSNTEITAMDCVRFIENWETDIAMWNRFLLEIET